MNMIKISSTPANPFTYATACDIYIINGYEVTVNKWNTGYGKYLINEVVAKAKTKTGKLVTMSWDSKYGRYCIEYNKLCRCDKNDSLYDKREAWTRFMEIIEGCYE